MTNSETKADRKSDSQSDGPQDSIRAASRDAVRELLARQSKSETVNLHSSWMAKRRGSRIVTFLAESASSFLQFVSDATVRMFSVVPWKVSAATASLCLAVSGLL